METHALNAKFVSFLVMVLILVDPITSAAVKSQRTDFKFNGLTLSFDIPQGWRSSGKLFGVPLSIVGPFEKGKRAVITVTPTGSKSDGFPSNDFEKDQRNYKKGRLNYLKTVNGKALKFHPYRRETWTAVQEVHRIGYEFLLHGHRQTENSYFITCKKNLIAIGTLLEEHHQKKYGKTVRKILKSMSCRPNNLKGGK